MEEFSLVTPTLLFSAVSLIMLAYTNRFVRPYKTENFYALLSARKEAQPIAKQQKGRKARRQKA